MEGGRDDQIPFFESGKGTPAVPADSHPASRTDRLAHAAMIGVDDHIDGMLLTTGAADCRVPQVAKLAIGHIFVGTDEIFRNQEWSDLHWELYLDDQLIDLKEFSTYSYVLPTMAPNPSLIREVLMKFTAWDIVLTNLQPGAHTLD